MSHYLRLYIDEKHALWYSLPISEVTTYPMLLSIDMGDWYSLRDSTVFTSLSKVAILDLELLPVGAKGKVGKCLYKTIFDRSQNISELIIMSPPSTNPITVFLLQR